MNSWIVQFSSQIFMADYYLDEYVRFHLNESDWWLIHKKHEGTIDKNDIVYIWKAQSEPSPVEHPEYYSWKETFV
jgi:hypothetical protein